MILLAETDGPAVPAGQSHALAQVQLVTQVPQRAAGTLRKLRGIVQNLYRYREGGGTQVDVYKRQMENLNLR